MEVHIGIWGDSITSGANDYEKGGWVNRLNLLSKNNKEYTIVYNLGIEGNTSSDIVKRFKNECEARGVNVILFAIGTNDSLYINNKNNPYVAIEKFGDNLQNLIKLARKYTSKIGFIGSTKVDESKTMPIPWDTRMYHSNENIQKYDNTVRKIAEENELSYLYMFDLLSNNDLSDGLHPNADGHEKMFLKIKGFVVDNFLN